MNQECILRKRRHRTRTGTNARTPVTTRTESRFTNVRDPRAAVRFSLDDRVAWDESPRADGSMLMCGRIIGFVAGEECMVRIRLDNGEVMIAPTALTRLRRLPAGDYGDAETTMNDPTPSGIYWFEEETTH